MALQIHMPLSSNITNCGTSTIATASSNITLTSSGAPITPDYNFEGSYSFNNSNSYISLTSTDLYSTITGGSQPFTIMMWVYHNDSTRAILFGDYSLSGAINFNIELTTAHLVRFYWNGSPDITATDSSVGLQAWAHVAIVYDGTTVKFYVNKTLKYTYTGTLTTRTKTSGSYYLGRDNRTGNTTLNGKLNDFRLYNEALTAEQISSIYYTDTETSPIIINKLTTSQYESIIPEDDELYFITDADLETTNHKVQIIDSSSTNTQYPSATAVNSVTYQNEPFWIQPTENGYVGFNISGTLNELGSRQISYSFDKSTWTSTTLGSLHSYGLISVSANQKIYFKSSATTNLVTESQGTYAKVVVKKTNSNSGQNAAFITGGKLISLFNGQAGKTFYLFIDSKVTDASQLDVNYNDTACTCEYMFAYCSSLIKAPVLSALNLPDYAYHGMFDQCTHLTEVSALPAETLSYVCYGSMFSGCTALKYPPIINATTLSQMSCSHMFYGCTALETAPELLGKTMAVQCYQGMFRGCTSLKQIPKLYSTELANSCYSNMFNGCTSLELQTAADGTHFNIVKIPEKPKYDWTLTWNNSMETAPDGTVTLPDTLDTYQLEAYKLPNSTTFNGSSNYIDTGIKLLDTDKDFTVMIDFAYGTSPGQYNTAIDCMISASPYNRGLCLYYNNTTPAIIPIYYTSAPSYTADQNRHKVIFRHNAGDAAVATLFYDSSTGVALNGSSYTAVNKNVYLGCRLQDSGSRDRYFKGTMYDARIYLETLSDTNISNLINGTEPTEFINPYYSIRGNTLTDLVFSSNSVSYDSIQIDATGNMYYGTSGTYTKVYDIANGWVNTAYKTLAISNNSADFEDKFADSTSSNLYNPNTVTVGYYINSSGVITSSDNTNQISDYIPVVPGHSYTWTGVSGKTGTNNKRAFGYATTSTTTGTQLNYVAVTGTDQPYTNTFTVPSGYNYIRISFNVADTDILVVDNDSASQNIPWAIFKNRNLTITYPWDTRGLSITGMNFKSNNTDYVALLVNNEDNISYGIKPYYIYARSGGNYLKDMPIFKDVFKVVIYSQNHEGSILYTWTGEPSEVQGNDWNGENNHLLVNGVSVWGRYAGIIGWDIYSWNSNSSGGSGYNTQTTYYENSEVYTRTHGWTDNNYKILTSTYNLGQHFTGANWKDFFSINKNTNISTTITVPSNALTDMFTSTGGTWTGTPTINKAYFTNATLVPDAYETKVGANYPEIWWKDTLVTTANLMELYKLSATTAFNGTSTYIDTGVKLLQSDIDFSLFVDFQYNSQTSMMTVFHCVNEASPYPGILLDAYNSYFRAVYYGAKNIAAYDTNRHKILFTHVAGTTRNCLIYFDSTTGVANTIDRDYTNVSQNLLLGCYQTTNGTKGRFLNGTIYSCIIYNNVLNSVEISNIFSGNPPDTSWSVKNSTLSVKFISNNITYNKLRIDSSGSMYYGIDNTYTIVYNVNTGVWTDSAYKQVYFMNNPALIFTGAWANFLAQNKS